MRKLGSLATALAITLAAPTSVASEPPVRDGPFGLYIGEPISQLTRLTKDQSGFLVVKAPRPAVAFPIVTVEAYPATGVCAIVGQTEQIDDGPEGHRVREQIDHLADLLATKYGAYKKLDTCGGDADACSKFWLYELSTHVAKYIYAWPEPTGGPAMGVSRVALTIQTSGGIHSAVVLLYSNTDKACETARSAADSAGL